MVLSVVTKVNRYNSPFVSQSTEQNEAEGEVLFFQGHFQKPEHFNLLSNAALTTCIILENSERCCSCVLLFRSVLLLVAGAVSVHIGHHANEAALPAALPLSFLQLTHPG